ncbi:MAG: dienelactone hydrolase family protein [Melioribacteraceae bacterium]|jgi:pimeloyl-ACP methyl ester carboxylesterase|nr:dienelactone hydrolase family protein [Melioribacteraceae bacterium]RJP56888.1 MAG: alpha/beta hydrolase [Ignavibacteriales bacterium]WKZ68201.1 MAG: dienelactone hydrolase family protein [Melioribacteraceae bacterium]
MSKDYVLETNDNEKIRIRTFGKSENPCIIFVHGFKGFKDWGFGPYLSNFFAEKGFFVITFNFSLNGVGESLTEFDELEKFAQNTFSREIDELNLIIRSYRDGFFTENISSKRIGLLGHSRGGAISILTSSQNENVNAVSTWSAIAKLDRYSDRQKKDWKEKGYFEVLNSRTNQMMRMNLTFLIDIEQNQNDKLNIENAVKKLKKPLFIAHGDQDLAVPIDEGNLLYNWSDKNNTEIFVVHNAGHTFNIQHPFSGSNDKFEKVLNETNKFFKKHLN